jgi:hypothetical protein
MFSRKYLICNEAIIFHEGILAFPHSLEGAGNDGDKETQ